MFHKFAEDLLSGTAEEAVEKLARLAVARKARVKSADFRLPDLGPAKQQFSDILGSTGRVVGENPMLANALIGGGLGAAAGGLHAAVGNRDRDPQDRRSVLGRMLTGGLAGAGIGGGLSMARTGLNNLRAANPSSGGTGTGVGGSPSNTFIDHVTGRKMQIPAEAVAADPGLPARARELTATTPSEAAAGTVGAGLSALHDLAPTTTTVAAPALAADAALHNPWFGMARKSPSQVGGRLGREFLFDGLPNMPDKAMKPEMRDALIGNMKHGPNPGKFGDTVMEAAGPRGETWLSRLTGRKPKNPFSSLDSLGHRPGSGVGDRTVAKLTTPETETIAKSRGYGHNADGTHNKDVFEEHDNVTRRVLDDKGNPKVKTYEANEGNIGDAKRLGYEKSPYKGRQLYGVPGTNRTYGGMTSIPRALGMRAGLIGAAGLGEYTLRGMADQKSREDQIREMISRVAKPIE